MALYSGEDSDSILKGFTITGGYFGLYINNSSPIISQCVFKDNSESGVYCHTGSPAISSCRIIDNGEKGLWSNAGSGNVINCVVAGNIGTGIEGGSATIANCTIVLYSLH